MNERREYPAPIQLLDGRLLVVSGHAIAGRALKSAELFEPVTKRWAPTADMHNARQGGGGVVLLDGRIFVGESFGTPDHFPSEIYRPATADWIVAAKMNEGRQNCTLTRLSDGRVLATGGIDWSTDTTLASAEIYDPESNAWTRTAPLDRPRFGHLAISLPDGRVMIVGGDAYPNPFDVPLATTIYDPKTASWSPGPTMGRTYYVAASVKLEDGNYLLLGQGADNNRLRNWNAEATAEVLDVTALRFRSVTPLPRKRLQHPLVKLSDGRIFAPAGSTGDYEVSPEADVYDSKTDRWSTLPAMHDGRRNHGASLLPDGSVLVMGGSGAAHDDYLATVELFTPCK